MSGRRRDVFLSYASEDKETLARPLTFALASLGVTVWFDDDELEAGDTLPRRIDEGLAGARHGVVILSPAFFGRRKTWTPAELAALQQLEHARGKQVLIPVWHGVDERFLARRSPLLAARVALRAEDGLSHVAQGIAAVVHPATRRVRRPPRIPNDREFVWTIARLHIEHGAAFAEHEVVYEITIRSLVRELRSFAMRVDWVDPHRPDEVVVDAPHTLAGLQPELAPDAFGWSRLTIALAETLGYGEETTLRFARRFAAHPVEEPWWEMSMDETQQERLELSVGLPDGHGLDWWTREEWDAGNADARLVGREVAPLTGAAETLPYVVDQPAPRHTFRIGWGTGASPPAPPR